MPSYYCVGYCTSIQEFKELQNLKITQKFFVLMSKLLKELNILIFSFNIFCFFLFI